jgi:hypothetical protein
MCCCVGLITVVMVCHRVAEGGGVGGGEVEMDGGRGGVGLFVPPLLPNPWHASTQNALFTCCLHTI